MTIQGIGQVDEALNLNPRGRLCGSPSYSERPPPSRRASCPAAQLLSNKYSESRVAFGVTANGGLVEVLKSGPQAKTDTWTIIITTPKGVSCLVAAGEGWRDMEQVAADPET